jgi:hypothetical protein
MVPIPQHDLACAGTVNGGWTPSRIAVLGSRGQFARTSALGRTALASFSTLS